MPTELWNVLFDLLVLVLGAALLGAICERFRQNAILGYLLAGTILGPNALAVVRDAHRVEEVAELGVALLLFTIGLEFSWRRLRRMGVVALGGGALQVGITLMVFAVLSYTFGLDMRASIAVGAIAALSSTALVLRLLREKAELESIHGRLSLGILLFQDLAVVPLVLLMEILRDGGDASAVTWTVIQTFGLALVFVVVLYLLLAHVAPRLLGSTVMHRNRDLPILIAVVIGLGAAWTAHAIDLSPALGAFVAGMLLAETPFAAQIRADVASLRTLLITIFFASIGMIGDPLWILANWLEVSGVIALLLLVKPLVIWGIFRALRQTNRAALTAGLCLAQVGEFSFVIAQIAVGGLISQELFKLIVSATIGTLFLTPFLIRYAPECATFLTRRIFRSRAPGSTANEHEDVSPSDRRRQILVIGFGPAGRTVAQDLDELEIDVTILELNPKSVAEAKTTGLNAHLGDASHPEVLEHLHIDRFAAIVLTLPDPGTVKSVIHHLRALAPKTPIIVRARYNVYRHLIESWGATVVVDEEYQVGHRLAGEARRAAAATEPPS